MSRILNIPGIQPKVPGLLSRAECATYLNVGRNEVTPVMKRFGIAAREDHYSELLIWKRILGVTPIDEDARAELRFQLQDINWVSERVGKSVARIRGKIRAGSFEYHPGVQLGSTDEGKAPRLRRWVPHLILDSMEEKIAEDFLYDEVADTHASADRANRTVGEVDSSSDCRGKAPSAPNNNVFAQIVRGNAQ